MKKTLILFLFLTLLYPPCAFADVQERANIYYNNGVTYFKDKKYSSAILEFKKVLRVRPYDKTTRNSIISAYIARAQYYKDTEKAYKKAMNDYRSALVYMKYWDSEYDNPTLIKGAEDNLNYLRRTYAPSLKSAENVNKEAKLLRAEGELLASIYEYTTLYKNQALAKSAYANSSDIYKSLNNQKMAIDCIRKAINLDNKDGMLHFKYAMILDDIQNEDAAMDEYSKALEYSNNNKDLLTSLQNLWMARSVKNPKDSQALINLGAILQKQNQLELAREQYIKARNINPNDPVILINLASVYTALNDYDNALRVYDEILLKNKGDLSARYYKGKLYEKRGDIASAMKQYKEILSLKKDDENAKEALNNLLSNLNGDQLQGYLQNEALNNPQSYDAQFKYAYEMHKNKKYIPAIEFYKKAIAISPNHEEPFINLAQIFILQNEYDKAKNAIAHGLSVLGNNKNLLDLKDTIEKTNANNLYAKGTELYNNKDFAGALQYYSRIPIQTPEILTIMGNCYFELNDSKNALLYYNKVLEKDPKNENALLMSANLLMNNKREEEAKTYLNKILAINPNNQDAKNTLKALNEGEEGSLLDSAISLYEAKRFDEAMNILDKLVAKNNKNPYAHYYKGSIFEEKGEIDKAIVEYKNSINSDPKFALGYYMAAVALDTKEQYKEAAYYYDKYIVLKSNEGVEDEFSKYAKTRTKELKDYLSQAK